MSNRILQSCTLVRDALRSSFAVTLILLFEGLFHSGWAAPALDFSYAPTPEERAYLTNSFGYPPTESEFGQSFLVLSSGRIAAFEFEILTTDILPPSGNLVLGVYSYTLDSQSRPIVSPMLRT